MRYSTALWYIFCMRRLMARTCTMVGSLGRVAILLVTLAMLAEEPLLGEISSSG